MVTPVDPRRGESWWRLFELTADHLDHDVQQLWQVLEDLELEDLGDEGVTSCLLAMAALTRAGEQLRRAAELGQELLVQDAG